jgi:UDP-2-acetamido-2-deoxy-ribo-hexuluronate aminotransferase
MQFIDLATQASRIEQKLLSRFKNVLAHSAFVMGPEIYELEEKLAKFVGVNHAITVSSGTDALLIALMALGIKEGDEVITTPFSFFATAEVILLLGATPVFVDIDPMTYNINPDLLEVAITPKTKAIMPVSLYGQCADFEKINAIAAKYNLPVIEDAAQSFGATYKGHRSCSLTTIACTSFFPSKPLGCYGDGGACFTDDDNLAQKMKEIRVHGQSERYLHTSMGINGRFDTIQAAFLLEKFAIFAEEIELRQNVADVYAKILPAHIKKPFIVEGNMSVYAQYTIELDNREFIQKRLQENGIPTAVHYPKGLHRQPIVKQLSPSWQVFPHTDRASERVMSLPMHPYMTAKDQKQIAEVLAELVTVNTFEEA